MFGARFAPAAEQPAEQPEPQRPVAPEPTPEPRQPEVGIPSGRIDLGTNGGKQVPPFLRHLRRTRD